MPDSENTPGGIKTFSVGLGLAPHGAALSPPPAYRVLILGDFAISQRTVAQDITGLDLTEVLDAFRPSIPASFRNLLGSHPETLTETIELSRPRDLNPATLSKQFAFIRDTAKAAETGDVTTLAEFGQRYESLLFLDKVQPVAGKPSPTQAHGPADISSDNDLDGLFSMIDVPGRPAQDDAQPNIARMALDAFISDTTKPAHVTDPRSPTVRAWIDTALKAQCREVFGDDRFRQVLESWHGLRVLLSALPRAANQRIALFQLPVDATAEDIEDAQAGVASVLNAALFDMVVVANRFGLQSAGIPRLKRLAKCVEAVDSVCLATIEPDIAGEDPAAIGVMDSPHQLFEAPGFEPFHGLRQKPAAANLVLFWNDARASLDTDIASAIFVPASWIALINILKQQSETGWPQLATGERLDIDHLEVAEKRVQGRTLADAVRATVTVEASASLNKVGINPLEGEANRSNVFFRRMTTARMATADDADTPGNRAVLTARLNTLLQDVLGDALPGHDDPDRQQAAVEQALAELAAQFSGSLTFSVGRVRLDDHPYLRLVAEIRAGKDMAETLTVHVPALD